MRKIVLSTESGADVPADLAREHAIEIVPMHVIMDGKDHLDGFIPVKEIYSFYDRTKKIPSTTSTNPNEYTDLFTKIRHKDPDSIIVHIGYTSKASSSFQHATIAAEDFEDIFLIDALNVSGGLAAIVLEAADMLKKEPDIEPARLVEKIKNLVPKSRLAFVPGSLEFLRAGGRVSNAAYLGGSLLKIKPLIELVDGKLVSTKKYRGKMNKVAEQLLREYFKKYKIDKKQLYFLYSLGFEESMKQRIDEVAKEEGYHQTKWVEAGAVISTHGGPGAFGVAGLEE